MRAYKIKRGLARRRAFTLIELLVVIAIISLLVSILLPTLTAAKEHARSVMCMGNLSQIGNAILYYASDNNDCLLPSYTYPGGWPMWWDLLNSYLETAERDKYGLSMVYHCPTAFRAENLQQVSYTANRDKMYNKYWWAGGPVRFGDLDDRIVLIVDSTGVGVHVRPYPESERWGLWFSQYDGTPIIAERHNGRANSLSAGMHIESRPLSELDDDSLW